MIGKITSLVAVAALSATPLLGMAPAPISHAATTIAGLNQVKVVASTIDSQNGDLNPYGLTYDSYAGTNTSPNPFFGDFLVSNFSNSAGTSGAGDSIEAINPKTGAVQPFSHYANGPVALAVSPKGPVWVANFGQMGTDGNVEVLKPNGTLFPGSDSMITNADLGGPWGQVFVPGTTPAFLVTNALTGTVDAMYDFSPPTFNTDTQFAVIGSGLAHQGTTAATVQGPQGMVYDPMTHMIYVTDTADNSIRAFFWTGSTTPNQGTGQLVFQGAPLAGPAGITINPINGDLLVVNTRHNTLVELTVGQNGTPAHVVAIRLLDKTPVNPRTGAGSALFGVYAMKNAQGQLRVYFTDDNTNTLDVLK